MTAYEEQEDLEKLKAWWKEYGNALIFGILLGGAVLVGFRYWKQHTEERLLSASVVYQQMLQDLSGTKPESARKSAELLINDYTSTPYADMAGLLLARLDVNAGDVVAARKHLQWVLDHARDAAVLHAARLRLARLYLNAGEKDSALALVDVKDQAGFETEYQELKGDIYAAQGKPGLARTAYREALKYLPAGSPYGQVLNMKLDDLGPEKSS